jgi:predicted CXXCH cytochrome family protein
MRVKIGAIAAVLLLTAAAWLFGCGSGIRSTNPTSSSPNPAASPSLESVMAEVESYPVPAGVSAELFESLRSALLSELAARSSGKLVSTPPSGPENTPALSVVDDGAGGWNLTWGYYNIGDYDQNGTVGISDITPIAVHFKHRVGDDPLDEVVDGSGNEQVGIEDITPLAVGFGKRLTGYRLQGSLLPGGPFEDVSVLPLTEASGDGRLTFALPLPTTELYVRVIGEEDGAEGAVSDPIRNESPADYPEPATGFVGPQRCLTCHSSDVNATQFNSTAHMLANRLPDEDPGVVADWSGTVNVNDGTLSGSVTLSQDAGRYLAEIGGSTYLLIRTIGGGFGRMQAFVVRDNHSDYVLPMSWSEQAEQWQPYHMENWFDAVGPLADLDPASSFERSCIGCHASTGATVAYNDPTGEWLASYLNLRVSCERCHGPGETHANAPSATTIFNPSDPADGTFAERIAVCGQCHSRGQSGDALGGSLLDYPWNAASGIFEPGNDLGAYWTLLSFGDTGDDGFWTTSTGTSYAKSHVQQYTEYTQSLHYGAEMACWTCHNPHRPMPAEAATTAEANALCYTCHVDRDPPDLTTHTHHAETSPASRCVNCHMTPTGTTALPWDTANHTFKVIPPSETILMLDASSPNPIINSCMATDICHGGPSSLTDRPELVAKQADYDSFYGGG